MSLNVEKGVFVAPTTTGQQTYTLPTGFDAKALLLVATYETADGITDGHGIMSIGFGTYDGGAVQQQYLAGIMEDAGASSNTASGCDSTAILKGFSDAVPTVDYEAHLVSLGSDNFVLDWVNAPASTIRVHYWVLGGSDIARAWADKFTTATSSPQQVTLTSGFGAPDLVLFIGANRAVAGDGSVMTMVLGAAIPDERGAALARSVDASPSGDMQTWRSPSAFLSYAGTPVPTARTADLSNRNTWAGDEFALDHVPASTSVGVVVGYLALRGTFVTTIGRAAAPIDTPPQTQPLTFAGNVPKGALFWGCEVPANVSASNIDNFNVIDADLGGFWLGMTDGTNQGLCAIVEDEGAVDCHTGRVFTASKAAAHHLADPAGSAPTLTSEADASIVGDNVLLEWTTTDTREREFNYLIVGEQPANIAELQTQAVYEGQLSGGGRGLGG